MYVQLLFFSVGSANACTPIVVQLLSFHPRTTLLFRRTEEHVFARVLSLALGSFSRKLLLRTRSVCNAVLCAEDCCWLLPLLAWLLACSLPRIFSLSAGNIQQSLEGQRAK